MKNIIFATNNKGKADEVKEIFKETDVNIVSLFDLGDNTAIEETGETFKENALIKAKTIYEKYGEPVIADDSGLAVDQLDGKPGIYSARYAGENCTFDDNNKKLVQELAFFDEPHKAKFVCGAVFYNGTDPLYVEGELPGEIINEPRGDQGFGYDPIFVPEGKNETLAEIDLKEKNKLSHRAKAFNSLKKSLI